MPVPFFFPLHQPMTTSPLLSHSQSKCPLRVHLRNKLVTQPETSTDVTGRIPRSHALILPVIKLMPSRSPGPCSESLFIKIKIKWSKSNLTCIPQRSFVRLKQNNVWLRTLYPVNYFSLDNLNMLFYSLI